MFSSILNIYVQFSSKTVSFLCLVSFPKKGRVLFASTLLTSWKCQSSSNAPSLGDYICGLDSALILNERFVISIHPAYSHASIAYIT